MAPEKKRDIKIELLRVKESTGIKANNPEEIYKSMYAESMSDRECMWVLHLNTQNEIIEKELVSMGSLNQTIAHPREVFRKAVIKSTNNIIIVHNHPSGCLDASREDIEIKERFRSAGKILGINLIDFIIISNRGYRSLSGDSQHRG